MSTEPTITERPAMPYVAITTSVTMREIGVVVPPLNQEVFRWLATHGVEPSGAPFWKYDLIDMERSLEIEAGVTTRQPVQETGECRRVSCRPAAT